MNKTIIITSFIIGVCLTITVWSVYRTIKLYDQVNQNTIAIQGIVSFINQTVASQKK